MWKALKVSPAELRLEFSLPTGQSFRWRKQPDDSYIGVVRDRVFHLKQTENDIHFKTLNKLSLKADDDALLRDYFNLDCCSIKELSEKWIGADDRFSQLAPFVTGARVLRQDPLECLFQFLASQNNNIGRIQGMVESLCRMYGSLLYSSSDSEQCGDTPSSSSGKDDSKSSDAQEYYAFPTLVQLEDVTEARLRQSGFGYRAKYIKNCVQALNDRDGEKWLWSLRSCLYEDAVEQLCQLPGVGPKVASCVCLFSLDKHQAIPVDTHVHQLALNPELENKSLTKRVMKQIEDKFGDVFGEYAGWAHNVLFVGELASHQTYLPKELRTKRPKRKRRRPKQETACNKKGCLP